MNVAEESKLELSCKEANLLLRVIPINKNYSDMNAEESAALDHYCSLHSEQYGGCRPCKKIGLNNIISQNISCKEALEICAEKPGPFYLGIDVQTIKDILALEHIWGRIIPLEKEESEKRRMAVEQYMDNCKNRPCISLMGYWAACPLSAFYDGENETAGQIPYTIKLFIEQKWPIDNLLAIQKERMNKMLRTLKKGEDRFEHYWQKGHLTYEIKQNIEILQDLLKEQMNKS